MMEPFSTRQRWGARLAPVAMLAVSAATTTYLFTGWRDAPRLFAVASGVFTAAMVAAALSALAARLTLDASGVLTSHGLRAASTRRVDLSRLVEARAVEEASVSGTGGDRRISVRRALDLRDGLGQHLRVDPRTWQRGDLLIAAIEAAAAARDVPVQGGQLFGMGATEPGPAPEVLDATEAPPVPDRDLAFPQVAQLRVVLAVFGLVVGFIGLTFLAVSAGSALLPGPAGDVGGGGWIFGLFPLLGALMVVASPLLLLSAAGNRVTLRRDGRLAVWVLPWPRRVRLADLTRVEARAAGYRSVNAQVTARTRVVLQDRAGGRAAFIGESWRDPGVLMPAIAAWAARAGVALDAAARDYLLHGRPPAPHGGRPAAP